MNKEISGLHGQPQYHFEHADQEYFIYIWVDSSNMAPQKACLAVPESSGGGYIANNVMTWGISQARIDSAGGVNKFMSDIFLPKVNVYLAEQGGGSGDFLVDGSNLEQFNWVVENSLHYSSGKVIMV